MAMNDKLKRDLLRLADVEKLNELRELAVSEERFEDAAIIRDEIADRFVQDHPLTPDEAFGPSVDPDEQWVAWICKNGGHVHLRKDASGYKCYPGDEHVRFFHKIADAKTWVREECSGKNFYRGICEKRMAKS